jgi:GTP pyrophosphokinase
VETKTSSARRISEHLLEARGRLTERLPTDQGAHPAIARGAAIASIVEALGADEDLVLGALAFPGLDAHLFNAEQLTRELGPAASRLATELGQVGRFATTARWDPAAGLSGTQAESLRKMLLAIVHDPRLVVVRLAEQLELMRSAKRGAVEDQRRLALETRELYAPLANRLGVWQLKWELEDLALRYLEPEAYHQIATGLGTRRVDRERYLEEVRVQLAAELERAGVSAEIEGRPKHIYSIWRKMQRKQLPFEQVFDVRALRVRVGTVADCYAALGVVHGLWPFIAGEFDDYIATPKDNGYRSIHTAVTGPGGLALEVQIRTHAMHAQAELGVGSHWRYKEGGPRDAAYELKIDRLRHLLEPRRAADAHGHGHRDGNGQGDRDGHGDEDGDLIDRVRAGIFEDRVYVLSPKGDVVELPKGATPLDFAYHVHTDLGHRCRGARVDGRIVSLDYLLKNSEVVEIVAGKVSQPSRDWLIERLGFLVSTRSRAKVRAWFRKHDEEADRVEAPPPAEREPARSRRGLTKAPVRPGSTGVAIQGIDNLLCNFSKCCRPVPPESIAGYITLGRGVSIHRADCGNLARLKARQPDRLIEVDWGDRRDRLFSVEVAVVAWDRQGLVRDVSAVFADEKINIERMTTVTDARERTANIALKIAVHGLDELSRILSRVAHLPNVLSARRRNP